MRSLPGFDVARRLVLKAPAASLLLLVAALSGCVWVPGAQDRTRHSVYEREQFQRDETFSRLFDTPAVQACEGARRALLSQGYVMTSEGNTLVNARKRFQPDGDVHMEIVFTVVCVPENARGNIATAFVSAQQDRYVIRRRSNTTSLGVGGVGSISVPLSSSEDELIKVGSETIASAHFYDRFFNLMQRMLVDLGAAQPIADAGLAPGAAEADAQADREGTGGTPGQAPPDSRSD